MVLTYAAVRAEAGAYLKDHYPGLHIPLRSLLSTKCNVHPVESVVKHALERDEQLWNCFQKYTAAITRY